MKQKDAFVGGEGDQWFQRNQSSRNQNDPLLEFLKRYIGPGRLLEVGCSDGLRLEELSSVDGLMTSGIEPSAEAVRVARGRGLDVHQGTADKLDFESSSFDWVVFGFCLYLCDRDDLFAIAAEADRVLKNHGRLVVYDFDPGIPCRNPYHHLQGLSSYKMDYADLFLWNPCYTLISKEYYFHGGARGFHEDRNERVSISMLYKDQNGGYTACDAT